jgi:PKHD-type hydroxylase
LSVEECDIFRNLSSELFTEGRLTNGTDYYVNTKHRIALNCSLDKQEYSWLYEKVCTLINDLNASFFRVDITGIIEDGLCIRYLAHEDIDQCGFFNWHKDTGKGLPSKRKLTVIVSLSDPNEYEGGDFHIFDGGDKNLEKLPKGEVWVIPSYLEHKVDRVTKGERHTLVFFASGPRYK